VLDAASAHDERRAPRFATRRQHPVPLPPHVTNETFAACELRREPSALASVLERRRGRHWSSP
jgi:hypothetical protein